MSKTQNCNKNRKLEEDLLPEYNFDYSKAKHNRFATTNNENITVMLEPDVAEIF